MSSFETELRTHIRQLRGYARYLMADQHAAEDLLQDTLLKAWEHASAYTLGTNMASWLSVIMLNLFRSQRKTRIKYIFVTLDATTEKVSDLRQQEHRAELMLLDKLFEKLTEDDRTLLVESAVGDEAYTVLARRRNVSVGAVKSRVIRARAKIKRLQSAA